MKKRYWIGNGHMGFDPVQEGWKLSVAYRTNRGVYPTTTLRRQRKKYTQK